MSPVRVENPEPLTLFTQPTLERIYDRDEILRERELGKLPRGRVDQHIAKVLPPASRLEVEPVPGRDDVVHVVDCAYRPYYRKELYAIAEMLQPAPAPTHPFTPTAALPAAEIVRRTLELEGTPYFFGGSAPAGSPRQAAWLVSRGLLREEDRDDADLDQILHSSGIDCSGLLNVATDYHFFGDSKDVCTRFRAGIMPVGQEEARDAAALARRLGPADLILFRGHVIISLGDGRVIQAVGDGINARSFARSTGWSGDPMTRYNRVVIDDAHSILRALIDLQGRRATASWHFDDDHLMLFRQSDA